MQTTVEQRPSQYSDTVNRKIAEKLAEMLYEGGLEQQDSDIDQIAEAVDTEDDGYKISKRLEDSFYWECNASMVETLDDAGVLRWQFHKEEVAEWVQRNGIVPELKAGELVTFTDRTGTHAGEIVAVRDETAEYTVCCEEMGHVKRGNGTFGVIIPFERVMLST